MSTQTAPNKETQHLIDWIDTEYSLDRWFNKSVDELKAMTHSLFYSGLDTNRSVADTLNDLIIVVIQDRIDWEYLIKQIEKLQSDRMADQCNKHPNTTVINEGENEFGEKIYDCSDDYLVQVNDFAGWSYS